MTTPRSVARPATRPVVLRAGVLAMFLAACGAASGSGTKAADPLAPTTLYPLLANSAWSYDVDTGEALTTLAISRVTTVVGSRVEVSSGGEPQVYEVTDEGIFRPQTGTWLLKRPIQVGATWDSVGGMTAHVVAVDATASVPAGEYHHCVRVEERGGEKGQEIATLYCPHAGPVVVESKVVLPTSGGTAEVRAALRGFTIGGAE